MNNQNTFLLFILTLFCNITFSQAELNLNKEKINSAFMEFFKMDRENIHLHLNKNIYLSTDIIWFKGYIIEKKNKKPFAATSNVHITLLDQNGEKLMTKLFFSDNSIFDGSLTLNKQIKTGTYYLQVYTNYMNNFAEDESSIFEIKIINPQDKNSLTNTDIINFDTATFEFFPESNVFLEGTANTIGVKITDCNGNGIIVKDGEIKDSKGVTITNFSTNELGYGKFDILQTKNELYKAVYTVNSVKKEKALPLPLQSGITFSVNNYTFQNKTTVKIKTNSNSINNYKDQPLLLAIQQDQNIDFIDFKFKENTTEELIILQNEVFSEGINTIYLIDNTLKKIGERIIFNPAKFKNNIDFKILKKQNDSISISGISNLPLGNISISVLPAETKSANTQKNINDSFVLNNHLSESTPKSNYYLSDFTKRKQYEFDTYLLSQKSKYRWENILISPPKQKFDFDNGLTFKGTINKTLTDKQSSKVVLSAITAGLNEVSGINDKNEFYFKNIIVSDSTIVHFSLFDKKEKREEVKLYGQILNNNRPFIKPFKIAKKECTVITNNTSKIDYSYPKIANEIHLDTVTVNSKSKAPQLTNTKRYNNSMAKGFKITENDANRDILQFIAANGFDVTIQGTNVSINGRKATSFLGTRSPLIFIDDTPVRDFTMLLNYSLVNVEEIYINKHGYGGGSEATNGIIRIYTKKGFGGTQQTKINSQSFVVKNGFQNSKNFSNPKYTSFSNDGYKNFGTIFWEPYIETDENGTFRFSIPNYYQQSVKIIVEGISSDGQLISETRTIEIP